MLRRPPPTLMRQQILMLVYRVTGNKERARGWGYSQLLAHTDLGYNGTRKTQYLEDNIIIVRVVRVKIT